MQEVGYSHGKTLMANQYSGVQDLFKEKVQERLKPRMHKVWGCCIAFCQGGFVRFTSCVETSCEVKKKKLSSWFKPILFRNILRMDCSKAKCNNVLSICLLSNYVFAVSLLVCMYAHKPL